MRELFKGKIINEGEEDNIRPGWIVKICKEDDMKGYLLLFTNPIATEGYDEWYPSIKDALESFNCVNMQIAWEKPIESILEEESNNLKQK